MALTLSRKTGEWFCVGEEEFQIVERTADYFIVQKNGGSDELFEIVPDRTIEVLPNVRISMGDSAHHQHVRVVIDAPREIRIKRGRLDD
jgi:sRNA-binding carbon storage regulator CsrA